MRSAFETFFRSQDPTRDKFLARLFGLFCEEVVRDWCECTGAPYSNLGRPTVVGSDGRGHTLDFTFQHRVTGRVYVAELKCELEFERYRYLRLTEAGQLRHHKGTAFQKLLAVAAAPSAAVVKVNQRPIRVDGAVLVWGATADSGREAVMKDYGFADVLSIEAMLRDLDAWAPVSWSERTRRLRHFSLELFDYLQKGG